MLFIIIHQVYELWFKQILFELDAAMETFSATKIDERDMLTINNRLGRIIEIQKILIDQINVLETMTPMDFLEFRDFLYPASGFQSAQFRLIENKLGLADRLTYNNQDYKTSLTQNDAKHAQQSEQKPSLFILLEKWLERTPFLQNESFDFWRDYRSAVEKRWQEQRDDLLKTKMEDTVRQRYLQQLDGISQSFASLFDAKTYERLQSEGSWRLSHRALTAALFIYLYRHEPILQLPFHFMQSLQTIDENFTQWRYRHALMVHRMIGVKMGTGGSSGHEYLKSAGDKHRIYSDLNNLATFFIPKSALPKLPEALIKKLSFQY
jgi:tryptophan 2,3-dioxygenase